jgi:hypothetical protein
MKEVLDAIMADTLRGAVGTFNEMQLNPKDIVSAFQNKEGKYVIMYKVVPTNKGGEVSKS